MFRSNQLRWQPNRIVFTVENFGQALCLAGSCDQERDMAGGVDERCGEGEAGCVQLLDPVLSDKPIGDRERGCTGKRDAV